MISKYLFGCFVIIKGNTVAIVAVTVVNTFHQTSTHGNTREQKICVPLLFYVTLVDFVRYIFYFCLFLSHKWFGVVVFYGSFAGRLRKLYWPEVLWKSSTLLNLNALLDETDCLLEHVLVCGRDIAEFNFKLLGWWSDRLKERVFKTSAWFTLSFKNEFINMWSIDDEGPPSKDWKVSFGPEQKKSQY